MKTNLNELEKEFFEKIAGMTMSEAEKIVWVGDYEFDKYFSNDIKMAKEAAYLCRKKIEDVLDTGARLPEQKEVTNKKCSTHCDWPNCTLEGCRQKEIDQEKEESQIKLWKEILPNAMPEYWIELSSKFNLTRKS